MNDFLIDKNLYCIDDVAEERNKEKFINFFYLLDYWMQAIEEGKEISLFFLKRDYNNIAIYGMGILGVHLKKQLEKNNYRVCYTIDKNIIEYNNVKYDLHRDMNCVPKVDVIVITPIMEYKQIKEELEKISDVPIISLEEVVLSL